MLFFPMLLPYNEAHSADGRSFIHIADRGGTLRARRSTVWPHWEAHWKGVHLATFFRREDARVFIRMLKKGQPC